MRIYVYNYVYSSERRGGGGKTLLDRDTSTFRYHTSCWTETLLTSVITLPAGQRHFYRQVLHFLLDRDTSTFRYYTSCWTETFLPSVTTLPAGQRHFHLQVLRYLLDRDTSSFRYLLSQVGIQYFLAIALFSCSPINDLS